MREGPPTPEERLEVLNLELAPIIKEKLIPLMSEFMNINHYPKEDSKKTLHAVGDTKTVNNIGNKTSNGEGTHNVHDLNNSLLQALDDPRRLAITIEPKFNSNNLVFDHVSIEIRIKSEKGYWHLMNCQNEELGDKIFEDLTDEDFQELVESLILNYINDVDKKLELGAYKSQKDELLLQQNTMKKFCDEVVLSESETVRGLVRTWWSSKLQVREIR